MTADYRKEWGVLDAIRELVQNCMDNSHCNSTFVFEGSALKITTHGYTLPNEVFALGESQKEANSRGGFGEGFKLAMLVLKRLGKNPLIVTGKSVYTATFEDSGLGVDTFHLTETSAANPFNGTMFKLGPLTAEEIVDLKHKLPILDGKPLPEVAKGGTNLIEARPGEIFVGGLYVCSKGSFKYGYDFCQSRVTLGCDRQIADMHGLTWETSRFWASQTAKKADEILNMLTENRLDVSAIQYHLTESQSKRITEAFVRRFGHVEIKQMGSSLGYGMSVSGGLYATMKQSGYTKVAHPWQEPNTPYKKLEEFLTSNKKHMRSKAVQHFKQLLEEAKPWAKK